MVPEDNRLNKREVKRLEDESGSLNKLVRQLFLIDSHGFTKNSRKLLLSNFFIGVIAGLGLVFLFIFLGALILYFANKVILLDMPVVSELIESLIDFAKEKDLL